VHLLAKRAWPYLKRARPYLLLIAGVMAVFWKLVLSDQYTFLDNPDLANQVLPWLQAQVASIRRGAVLLWNPYEWFGLPMAGQVQPGTTNPFTYLLALAPLREGYIQIPAVHAWFVLIHCVAAGFAYRLFRDLGLAAGASVVGGIFYAVAGYCGNTEWPYVLAGGIWAPLVFLFLLRSMRGRAPRKNAAWAGVMLGMAWLSGHHEPPVMLTLAVLGVCAATLARTANRRQALARFGIVFAVMALVGALQVLPAVEYGRLAKRWTASGGLTWNEKVQYREHEANSLRPAQLIHLVLPGGNALRTDPFVGVIGLSLAAIAVAGAFRRRETRLFLALAVAALLYALAKHNALYGPLYALFPMVEKSRSPIMALSVFHFAVAALAALGAGAVGAGGLDPARVRPIVRALAWFGAALFAAAFVGWLAPSAQLNADPRPQMTGLIALLLAGLYTAATRGHLRGGAALACLGLLLVVEHGNEVGWNWAHTRDVHSSQFLKPLFETRDVGAFLRGLPNPKRVHVNDNDIKFTFGDWHRLDGGHAFTVSMLLQTSELNWWQERLIRMYGINYEVSREPTRPRQVELFRGSSGIRVWRNPDAFPRAWTVHEVRTAPDETAAAGMTRDGEFDLRAAAVAVSAIPPLERCGAPDRVAKIEVRPSRVLVELEMECRGMLIVSDNWYPGWRAEVDGKAVPIWRVNSALRGVVVEQGRHKVAMTYRPWTVYLGLACALAGLLGAVLLQLRAEEDGPDLAGIATA
jgi:hypothetical protein